MCLRNVKPRIGPSTKTNALPFKGGLPKIRVQLLFLEMLFDVLVEYCGGNKN